MQPSAIFLAVLAGMLLTTVLGRLRAPSSAPPQIITINPAPPAAAPGCLGQLGSLMKLAAIGFLTLFLLRLVLAS